jgi:hypothetical protein
MIAILLSTEELLSGRVFFSQLCDVAGVAIIHGIHDLARFGYIQEDMKVERKQNP